VEARATAVADERALLDRARSGDELAFERLVEPYRRVLRAHCYRLLGSVHDADDALQETLLRAWRGIDRFEPHGSFRAWLYRIATNASLRVIERRSRAPESLDPDEARVASYLQPFPDHLLDTEAAVEERESLGLAFVSVLQLLPARQRAVLVLREVLGWPAHDVAELLDDSIASVNSALQRARATLERERAAGRLAREHVPASSEAESAVLGRFLAAWEAADVDGLMSLLTDDAILTMPPDPMRLVGTEAIGGFFQSVPAGGELERIRLVEARANGQPALAAYLDDGRGFEAYGIMVFAFRGDEIAGITGFAGYPSLFPLLGLPLVLER
jgi:RNA polymerase sigma-70 factor (TIGR02960 family)